MEKSTRAQETAGQKLSFEERAATGAAGSQSASLVAAIGLSLFWACLFSMLARNAFLDMATEQPWYHLALRILLFAAFGATALALALKADARRKDEGGIRKGTATAEGRPLALGAALYAVIAAVSAASFAFTGVAHPFAFDAVAWAASGASLCCLLFFWIPLLSKLPEGTLGACLSLSAVGGAALYLAVSLLPQLAGAGMLALCPLVSIGMGAVLRHDLAPAPSSATAAAPSDAIPPSAATKPSPASSRLSWAFGLTNVVYGIVFGLGAGSVTQLKYGATLYAGIAVALALGALGAAAFMRFSQGRVRQSEVLRMLFPVLVISLVPMAFFSGIVYTLCNLLLLGCYTFLVVVSVRYELRGAHERAMSPTYFVGMSQAALCAGLLGGFALALLPVAAGALDFGTLAGVAMGLVVLLAVLSTFAQNKMAHLQEPETAPLAPNAPEAAPPGHSAGHWKARCAAVAAEAGLTERETDVFLLLAKGRGVEHIQNKLSISGHTVKTHVSNIYRKMGINSREELIDLVEASKDAS